MRILDIISLLESVAPPALQEAYDNAGLLTGNAGWECTGVLCSLDATEEVVQEAIDRGCNMVVAHHPIVFGGLKKINGSNYVEKTVIRAIKNDIAIYAIHTNLDNVLAGVNNSMASAMGLERLSILVPKENTLRKLYTFVPAAKADELRNALFQAGAGQIGQYSECSFNTPGTGTFKAGKEADPYVGRVGERHQEEEIKMEMVFPAFLEAKLVAALKAAHPYEEVAFDIVNLANRHPETGAGIVGEFAEALSEKDFLARLKTVFGSGAIRHSSFTGKKIKKVALCGGAGSFLISSALRSGADAFVTADMKYHEFFDANGQLLIADIGHFESEQFTISLLQEILLQKFPTFAVLKTAVNTNPVHYFC